MCSYVKGLEANIAELKRKRTVDEGEVGEGDARGSPRNG